MAYLPAQLGELRITAKKIEGYANFDCVVTTLFLPETPRFFGLIRDTPCHPVGLGPARCKWMLQSRADSFVPPPLKFNAVRGISLQPRRTVVSETTRY